MPIIYNEEIDAWETKDLDEKEKHAMINFAVTMITEEMGRELADRIVHNFMQGQALQAVPKEEMGQA